MLIVMSGLPGVGKTAVAARVAAEVGGVHLSIDVIEDALRGSGPPSTATGVAAYEAARSMAELNLHLGHTVVVDAVNDSEEARDTWRAAARRTGVPLSFFLLVVRDLKEHRRRLQARTRRLSRIPEPTWDEVLARQARYAPWDSDSVAIDASVPLESVVREVVVRL